MTNFKKTVIFVGLGLFVFFVARAWLFVEYYSYFKELSFGEVLVGFIHGIRFDLNILFTFLSPMILLLNLPFKFTQNKIYQAVAFIFGFVILSTLAGILFGDVAYFDECKRHMGNEMFMLGADKSFIVEMIPLYFYHSLTAIFMMIAVGFVGYLLYKAPTIASKHPIYLLLLLIVVSFAAIRGSFASKPITIANAFIGSNTKQGTLSLNGAFTTFINYKRLSKTNLNYYELPKALENLGLENSKYPLLQQYNAKKSGLNVVLILFEGWNIDFVGAYGSKDGLTPNFDEIAKNSMKFNNFFACGQRSIEGIQCSMTGILGVPGNLFVGFGLENSNLPRLGVMLKKHNYSTIVGQTSNRSSYYVDSIFRTLGFGEFFGKEDMKILLEYPVMEFPKFGWDYEGFDMLFQKINNRKEKNFFGFLFTGTTHIPYPRLPKQFEKFNYDGESGVNSYKNTINYADWALGEFMKRAKEQSWFDDTVFIITADHTVRVSGDSYYKDFYHTPFLIYSPKHLKAQEVDKYASQLNIMPTIVDLLGFDEPFYALYPSIFDDKSLDPTTHAGDDSFGIISKEGYVHRTYERVISSDLNGSLKDEQNDKLFSIASLFYRLVLENRVAP